MAKYTLELRSIQADFFASMQDYPIFNESYREILNDKIYHACKFREIGAETPELWCEYLKSWMDVNMPEFNNDYKANEALLKLTPTQRLKIMEIFNGNRKGDDTSKYKQSETTDRLVSETNTSETDYNREGNSLSNETQNNTSNSTDTTTENDSGTSNRNSASYHSDFPQANLTDKDDSNYYSTGDYDNETERTETESNSNSTSQTTDNREVQNESENSEKSNTKVTGSNNTNDKTGVESNSETEKQHNEMENHSLERTGNEHLTDFELIELYRKTFVNIDKKIIRALKKDLFMNIW